MKFLLPVSSRPTAHRDAPPRSKERGFALIVTMLMMVLLSLLAVGLLGLSTISLRSSSQGFAMASARADARMALALAIGQLQRYAGPDQRVTARADVLDDSVANPMFTGVWESWQVDPSAPPSNSTYESARQERFLGWLASGAGGSSELDFPRSGASDPVTLWGEGSLGSSATDRQIVRAERVAVSTRPGAFAWVVIDEGVKARVNTPYRAAAASESEKVAQLGSGVRPNVSSLESLENLERSFFEYDSQQFTILEKGITWQGFGLATESLGAGEFEQIKALTHDVTTVSKGLFTNVAQGGLKEDFQLMADSNSLPSKYDGEGVYDSLLPVTGPSDPRWESFHELASLYKDSRRLEKDGGVPVLKASAPESWRAAVGSNPQSGNPGRTRPDPPPGVVLMPSLVKVQLVFSLLVRDIYNYPRRGDGVPKPPQARALEQSSELHGPWGGNFAGSDFDYLLHMLYTPVVTVHNPYNVALEFEEVKVLFGNVPFALQVFRNGEPQTREPAPLDTLFFSQSETGTRHKRFGMTLKTNGGSSSRPRPGRSRFRLLPGEVMMFSPYIDPNRTWRDEYNQRTFSDWDHGSGNDRTLEIDGLPGWRGDGLGFDLDWFCPSYRNLRISDQEVDSGMRMDRGGCVGAKATDEWSLRFAPLSVPGLSENKFTVEMFATTQDSRRPISTGVIEMDYEEPDGLQNTVLGENGTITFPKEGTINTMEMHSHAMTPIKDIVTTQPFAIVSAQAKTTFGGIYADSEDGPLASKPWAFGHAVAPVAVERVLSEHPANHSHDFFIHRLDNGTSNLLQFDPETGRGNFITGHTGDTGRKFGVMYDIPLAPLQSLTQLNAANPGGSSGYLPRFARPIGNSWAHPMLDPAQPVSSHPTGDLLDHSFLLNLALYDRFYFSGLADQDHAFGQGGRSTSALAANFSDGEPLTDPRLEFYAPDGRGADEFTELLTEDDAYEQLAAWQMINGPFNVNSTSVAAWKAMLGSIHDASAIYNQINKGSEDSSIEVLPPTDAGSNEARISRFRLPASVSEEDGGDPDESYWLGPREYSGDELERLAEEIVEQVRERGPFLSMADFVNRRLGSGDSAQKGALQEAIDAADLNRDVADLAAAGFEIDAGTVADYNYANPEAGAGPSYQGAPGYLSQADLLSVLGNAATPRSDTFTVRAYGESHDNAGNIEARAWCEAVVQRAPEFLDPADVAETPLDALTSEINRSFGRKFRLVSFRWLAPEEI